MLSGSPISGIPISATRDTPQAIASGSASFTGGNRKTPYAYQSFVDPHFVDVAVVIDLSWLVHNPQPTRRQRRPTSEIFEPIVIDVVSPGQSLATGGSYRSSYPYQSFVAPIVVDTPVFDQLIEIQNLAPFRRKVRHQTWFVEPIADQFFLPDIENVAQMRRPRFELGIFVDALFVEEPTPPETDERYPATATQAIVSSYYRWFYQAYTEPLIPIESIPSDICPYIPLRPDESPGFDTRSDFGFESQGRVDDNVQYRESAQSEEATASRVEDEGYVAGRSESTFEFGGRSEEESIYGGRVESFDIQPGRVDEVDSPPVRSEEDESGSGRADPDDESPGRGDECK